MTPQDWAGFILTLVSIGAIVLGGIRWYVGVQIKPVQEAVDDIRSETKTNGGTSMRDEIKSIKKEQEEAKEVRKEQKAKLDHMYDILIDFIANQNAKKSRTKIKD
jgi:hypothetical protein